NERDNLPKLVDRLLALQDAVEILVVDDGSPDGTGEWVAATAAKDSRIHLLARTAKNGLGRAYVSGFQWALEHGYDLIVQMDADFSHSPEDVPKLLEGIRTTGADLVIGSRYVDGIRVINWPLKRLVLSVGASYYVKWITGLPVWDPTGGFKCWRRRTLEAIDLSTVKSNGYGFQIEMNHRVWRRGLRVTEVPIIFSDRVEGTSKMSKKIVIEALLMVWGLLIRNGLRRSPRTS
ncbi:MAG: polyprenol monophosphomannose synthase, partial [Verrucomicrobia bacterium]|nr:polyprenol monophosphomannose synthase [Verrucomicrobiota bacterium]